MRSMNGLTREDVLALKRQLERAKEDIRHVLEEECSSGPGGTGLYHEHVDEEAIPGALNMGNAAVVQACVATVEAIDSSMLAIEAGNYGTCAACGEPIGVRRLRLVPTSTLCGHCAARAKQGTASH